MQEYELLERLSVALAIGLLIGIERGWALRHEAEGARTAGLRTLALTGLLGGTCGALALRLPAGAVVLGLSFFVYGAAIALFRYRETADEKTFGATTVVASFLTFALGALAVVAEPGVAAAAGVAAAGLLALKAVLHTWLARLTWEELRAGLLLLAMSLILLPLLPNRGFGPFEALNPYELWLMTILIAAVSTAGYIAMKWVGGRRGIALSGLAGGLVSSTAVTMSFAKLAGEHPERMGALVAGALLASATMVGRILLVAGTVNPTLIGHILIPLGCGGAITIALALWNIGSHGQEGLDQPLQLTNPFDLGPVLKFGAFLAVIMLAAKALAVWAGGRGVFALAAVSGIADVDAITLSMARLAGSELTAETAGAAILIVAAVNTLAKAAMAWFAGGRGPGVRLAGAAALTIAAGLAGYALSWSFNPFELLPKAPLSA